ETKALLRQLKALLDPKGLMNPGVLGFGTGAPADSRYSATLRGVSGYLRWILSTTSMRNPAGVVTVAILPAP
ncbi:MAG: FAD-linked oxidase C-terminal domain-containing protein, partial [Steroidobacteraceae bacterium]